MHEEHIHESHCHEVQPHAGCGCSHSCGCHTQKNHKPMFLRIGFSAVVLLLLFILPLPTVVRTTLALGAYLAIGYDVLLGAGRSIAHGEVFDENFLMAVATVGAILLAFLTRSYDFAEAIAVMLFYQVGELFESMAAEKSRRSIRALTDLRPDRAVIEVNGELQTIAPQSVDIGSILVVGPGERIAIDGIVISGQGALDTAALTGESLPRDVAVGDEVFSGCISLTGVLRIRTTKPFSDSAVSRILELTEESAARKSKAEQFIRKFAAVYTPAVCFAALALALVPPVARLLMGVDADWLVWVYRALSFLVISCPCALVMSIPLTFFAGLGGASRAGILIKGGNYLQLLSRVKTVVLDKTGTLTQGTFFVEKILCKDISEEKLLEFAAYAESASSHPLATSLLAAYEKPIDRTRIADIEELGGSGVTARVDGIMVAAGNARLMARVGAECPALDGTCVHIALDGVYAGSIVLKDRPKANAKDAILALRQAGAEQVVMLTGDNAFAAKQTADALGITQLCSELLPEDKVTAVEELLRNDKPLLFVGDGINDAPVLARADIGMAMGAMGSDAAIEAADVVLMDDDPGKIAKAIILSKRCMRIVYQNIGFTLLVKAACLALGAIGLGSMWTAIFADVGVMVLCVLNAMRALRSK